MSAPNIHIRKLQTPHPLRRPLHPTRNKPRHLRRALAEVRHALPERVADVERAERRARERLAEARGRDPVRVRDEPVVRVGEEPARVRLGLDVRDEQRAARPQEGREQARRVVDRREVVVRRAALVSGEGRG